MKRLARRTDLPRGASVPISVQRNSLPPPLPGRVVPVHPETTMMTPSPMARVPIPARAVIVIPTPVVVISAIADIDRNPDRLRSHRSKRARAEERGQQNSKFVFHNVFLSSYLD